MSRVVEVTGVMERVVTWGLSWALVVSLMSGPVTSHWNPLISACPGEGPRYGDHKCIHDRTHRVCAKLVEDSQSCEEVRWAGRSFWDITGQASWCSCMWAAANLVAEVGCQAMELDCAATDVDYV